ncbi:zinc-ribbon domain-containing protein [Acidovorax sp. SUPP950]|uniref:hypothetical protein n=1 Tax=unclassified Acidovorax TaxID=2684926 RepID=UPI0023D40B59|nr:MULTISPECIES: hypothetical protein [unclassified Acidovorax]GKS74826.1 zinc-ribbon domain-containing protein [Acidovorax sp. SUPP950]GKS85843.1 zinc-ribbon domain-containing protein [Acidovorax sp. SUPP1855]GKS99210.1 zinc-ribbon domain-containing protein [Acidovorax sp. SUPP3434]
MALVPCPECNRQISDQATACPGCGHPQAPAISRRSAFESGTHEGRHAGTVKAGIAGMTAASLGGWAARAVAVVVLGIVAVVAMLSR